ncbi:MAG: SDR family NAD(P)-dependent oxidoreductase [Alphaproteobacteria bacterium]|nr:SDR family NAD(P)-dependent oxidoreductase [Alphaproteobacteria bacterium]
MDLELTGKTALITGASKGIGKAVAETLAGEGCNLLLASRTEADLAAVRDEISAARDVQITIHPLDLSQEGDVQTLAAAAADVDILVNNAGAIPAGDLGRLEVGTIKDAWDLKVFGFVGLTKALYPKMCERGAGVIVNIIGMAGERPQAGYIAGAMGNASLMALTRALGAESVDHGVRVVGINPGPIETDRLVTMAKTTAKNDWSDEDRWRETLKGLPGDRAGTVEEMAWIAAFLASARASWLSGTIIMADGGQHSRPPA